MFPFGPFFISCFNISLFISVELQFHQVPFPHLHLRLFDHVLTASAEASLFLSDTAS